MNGDPERIHQLNMWLWVKTNGTIFGVGAPPILVYFSGDWDVQWGHGTLTHSHVAIPGSRTLIDSIERPESMEAIVNPLCCFLNAETQGMER